MGTISRDELLLGLLESIGTIVKECADKERIIAALRKNIEGSKIVDPTSAAYKVAEGILLVADPPKKGAPAQTVLRVVSDDEDR